MGSQTDTHNTAGSRREAIVLQLSDYQCVPKDTLEKGCHLYQRVLGKLHNNVKKKESKFSPATKTISLCIRDLSVRLGTWNLLEANMGQPLRDRYQPLHSSELNNKNWAMGSINLISFVPTEAVITIVKRNKTTKWDKCFPASREQVINIQST